MADASFEHKGRLAVVTGTLKVIKKDDDGNDYEVIEKVEDYPVLTIVGAKVLMRIFRVVIDKPLEITFKVFRQQRSSAQNRYMWGVVVPTVRAWLKETQGVSYTPDEVYTWLRVSILGNAPSVREVAGSEVLVMTGKRFSAMNTKEFAEAVDTILNEMAKRGCMVPEPKKSNFIHEFVEGVNDD